MPPEVQPASVSQDYSKFILSLMPAFVARAMLRSGAGKGIPHLGVSVRATDVRRHRYLRDRGLPHSSRLAVVFLKGDRLTGRADEHTAIAAAAA
jgi:hypothetical protein